MQKLLKLRHHRHTGRKLAHHHTSYRGLAVVLVACGLTMLMIQKASADDSYIVTAKVPAEVPSTPSEITNPLTGGSYSNSNVDVSGTCQVVTPAAIVQLWSGANMLGSSACAANGTFDMPITLLAGTHNITPRTSTITNDYGPDGAIWTATYNPPPPPPSQPGSSNSNNTPPPRDTTNATSGNPSEPALSASSAFLIYKPFQQVTVVVIIAPSNSPYNLTTDWGDGVVEQNSFKEAGRHELQHIYKKVGNFRLNLKLVDGQGRVTHLVLAAVNLARPNFVASFRPAPTIGGGYSVAWIAWISYLIAVVTTFLFWLVWHQRHRQLAVQPAYQPRNLAGAKRRRK